MHNAFKTGRPGCDVGYEVVRECVTSDLQRVTGEDGRLHKNDRIAGFLAQVLFISFVVSVANHVLVVLGSARVYIHNCMQHAL